MSLFYLCQTLIQRALERLVGRISEYSFYCALSCSTLQLEIVDRYLTFVMLCKNLSLFCPGKQQSRAVPQVPPPTQTKGMSKVWSYWSFHLHPHKLLHKLVIETQDVQSYLHICALLCITYITLLLLRKTEAQRSATNQKGSSTTQDQWKKGLVVITK